MAAPKSWSPYGNDQPPWGKPPLGSSSGPPGACMTPSRVRKVCRVSRIVVSFAYAWFRHAVRRPRPAGLIAPVHLSSFGSPGCDVQTPHAAPTAATPPFAASAAAAPAAAAPAAAAPAAAASAAAAPAGGSPPGCLNDPASPIRTLFT